MKPPAQLAVLVGWGFAMFLAFWLGARASERDWPSLRDRTVWTPAEMRRESRSQVFAVDTTDNAIRVNVVAGPPRGMIGYYGISSAAFFYGNAAVPGGVRCARMNFSTHTISNVYGAECER